MCVYLFELKTLIIIIAVCVAVGYPIIHAPSFLVM